MKSYCFVIQVPDDKYSIKMPICICHPVVDTITVFRRDQIKPRTVITFGPDQKFLH